VVGEADVKSGYTIHLTFSPNAFFANERLSKTLSYAEDGELSMRATPVEWKDPPPSADDAEPGGAASRKRPRGAAASAMDAATFLRAFLWVEGQDASCLLPGDNPADTDRPAGLAEAEAFCEAIKEDVWSNPLQFFERYTFHGEEDDGEEDEEDEMDERRQRKKV
jgi:template-activating factor I